MQLVNIMSQAICTFNEQEYYLIENDLSERCICARFAMHLTKALENTGYSNYIVDVEYNRGADGYERSIKRLHEKPITVDLIVHKRGFDCNYGFDNLICIEMKKSSNRIGCDLDEQRLANMTDNQHGYGYSCGVMILINMKAKELLIKKIFVGGKEINITVPRSPVYQSIERCETVRKKTDVFRGS